MFAFYLDDSWSGRFGRKLNPTLLFVVQTQLQNTHQTDQKKKRKKSKLQYHRKTAAL